MSDLTHPNPPPHALETRIPAPVVALLIAVAMHQLSPAVEATDVLVIVRKVALDLTFQLSGLCALAAFLGFMRSRTTINPLKPERASVLVTDGIYRYTRNPMYLSLLLLLLGYAIDLWRWPALLGPVAYVAYITRFQILPEERVLEAKFGDEYLGYKQKVRRWI